MEEILKEQQMRILGIESSCDETAAAVVEDGRKILSNIVSSQIAVHAPYGGVVPELASRKHVEAILHVLDRAMSEAGGGPEEIDALAVTTGPGLVGALLIGVSAAKAMAYALRKPLIAVNHLDGHMHSAFIEREPPGTPLVCLIVSGGHTALYHVEPDGRHELLGATRDDAAGEAFDKVAKLLGLGYPGGVVIDRLASGGDRHAFEFPRALRDKDSLEFSFSGLKTSVSQFIRKHGMPGDGGYRIEDLAASFQEAVVAVLVERTLRAARLRHVNRVAVVGGVAANRRLRESLLEAAAGKGIDVYLPSPAFCTDNAVMIASAGYSVWRRQGFVRDPLDVDAFSRAH